MRGVAGGDRELLPVEVGEGADLRVAYLSGAYLSGADLSGALLIEANLTGANLEGANLGGANLSGAKLEGAHVNGARLSKETNLRAAKNVPKGWRNHPSLREDKD